MIFIKRILSITYFLFLLSVLSYSQNRIDYYGIISTQIDSNMAKMTSDLYYTQLNEIQNFSVTDKRSNDILDSIPDEDLLSESALSFFAEIKQKINSEKWEVIIHLINKKEELNLTKSKEYDSFYKILMEQKVTLKESLTELLNNTNQFNTEESFNENTAKHISTDLLSGTWNGEENINKIVIMRSGRGFVIFNNGASMNISIQITYSDNVPSVLITQQGKTNASFYPELPRNVALSAAKNAEPIQWKLSLSNNNTLTGTKYTLVLNDNQMEYKNIQVSWNRKIN